MDIVFFVSFNTFKMSKLNLKSSIQSPANAVETKNVNNILHFMAEITDIRECNNPDLQEIVDDIAYYKSTSGSLYLWAECTREDGLSQSAMVLIPLLLDDPLWARWL